MMLERDETGEVANRICNDPRVLPTLANHPLDLRPLAQDQHTIILVGTPPAGCFVLIQILDGVWEFHGAVLPEFRGEWSQQFAGECIDYMFTRTTCIELMTRIPQGNLASLALARHFNFTKRWDRPAIEFRGQNVPFSIYSLTMQDWWPSDYNHQSYVLKVMNDYRPEKAKVWYNRWAALSRNG